MWKQTIENPILQEDGEVLAQSDSWIHPDFNVSGIRVGFIGGDGEFISARWYDSGDTYLNGEGMPTKWMKIPIQYERLEIILNRLFDEIKHGDEEHQAWLKNKINVFIENLIF